MNSSSKRQASSLGRAELEAVYAISRVVVETQTFEKALAEIVRLARTVFIFDNAVLYLVNAQTKALEPAFARAIGRGRSSAEDLAWGEMAAQEAFTKNRNFLHQPEVDPKGDRLEQRFYLGIPMLAAGNSIGALVFIRFGGPTFSDDQINLAEFIAAHASQVLEHKRLVERIADLEAERGRSAVEAAENLFTRGDLRIDFARAEVSSAGQAVSLSATEYRLLLQFARNAGKILTAEDLLRNVWGQEYGEEKEILWVSISRLRQKLERDPKNPELIVTRSGEGYTMP